MERAPEPTNVQFEHLGVRAAARLWRGATTWAWLILTLAVGFVLLSLTVSFKVEDAERGGGVGTQHAMLWVGVLVVLSTNLTLWWLGLRAASHEVHPTFSEQRSAATLKLSVALIASTGFLALAANILAPFAASAGFSPTFLGGVFPDFTPRWYHEVGLTLFVTVLACAAFAAARPAALAFVSASRRRRADMAVIQCDMNAAVSHLLLRPAALCWRRVKAPVFPPASAIASRRCSRVVFGTFKNTCENAIRCLTPPPPLTVVQGAQLGHARAAGAP